MKKKIGYVCLSIAVSIWIFTPFSGFLHLTELQMALFLPILIVCGELFFLAAIFFLGKEFMQKIKLYWRYVRIKLKKMVRISFKNK